MRKTTMVCMLSAMIVSSGLIGAQAQTAAVAPAHAKKGASHHAASTREAELREAMERLNQKYDSLAQKIEQMQQQLAQRDTDLQQAKQNGAAAAVAADKANARAEHAEEAMGSNVQQVNTLQGAVDDLKANSASFVTTMQEGQTSTKAAIDHPETLHFMGVRLKPGGYMAAETVWRRRGIGGDVNTQFSGIPFSGLTAGKFSEFNASSRQSRISLMTEGKLPASTLRGYYEADFLSSGTTSNDNQSNSYTLRQRQIWGQAELSRGLTITGGQMWSLVTEYKNGLTNTKEATPLTIDAQYNTGFSWERQFGLRVTQKIGSSIWAGFAIEEPQTLNIGGHNLPPLVYQQAGNGGGLYNSLANYSYNQAPDLIAKVAVEPGFGHYEVFAVGRFFRDRVFPNDVGSAPSALGAYTTKTTGGGIGVNARATFLKKLDLGAHVLIGDGVGRYGDSTLADVTAHPDGSLVPLHSASALATVEWHPKKRWDVYGYYGGDYVGREYYLDVNSGKLVGYGAPTNVTSGCNTENIPSSSPNGGGSVPGAATNCTADNRNIQEGTGGYWYRFYRGDRGMLQQGFQFSYVVRNTWLGVGGAPKAIDTMWFTSLRYYLPQ